MSLLPALAATLVPDAARLVTADTGPLLAGTRTLVAIVIGAAALFVSVLYFLPVRMIAATRRRVESDMRERARELQEEDRRRIARELHDGAGQALTAARLQLVALRESIGANPILERATGHVDEAIDEVRRSTSALAPPALAEFGLAGALDRHCGQFASASGLAVRCNLPDSLPALEAHVEIACYRIAQEALHNAARHSGATHAWVRLDASDHELLLEVGDDGVGIDDAKGGFGLDSIQERTRLAGGALKVLDQAGPGARIVVTLPIEPRAT